MAEVQTIDEFYQMWQSGPFTKKILVEGDSWVSHPFPGVTNLATQIDEFDSSYLMLNVGSTGDTAQEVFEKHGRQMRLMETILAGDSESDRFDMIFLSAAGNDIVGKDIVEFGYLHSKVAYPSLYGKKRLTKAFYHRVHRVVDGYRRFLMLRDSSGVNANTPVISHAYSYLIPRKVGTHIGKIKFNDGWLQKYMEQEDMGITDKEEQRVIIAAMLDVFHDHLKPLEQAFDNFLVADTRKVLSVDGMPNLDWWFDEIHPNKDGFQKVAEAIKAQSEEQGLWHI